MNRIKTGIKLQVTSEESQQVQEICFANGIGWFSVGGIIQLTNEKYLIIDEYITYCSKIYFDDSNLEEVDASLFIRTKGLCIEEIQEQTSEQSTETKPKQYMCYVPSKGKPKHIHQSLESAQEEAKRLCKSGLCDVMVLEVVSKYQAKVIVEEV